MSYAPRGPGRPQDGGRDTSQKASQKGSVRAARERLEKSRTNGLGIANANNPLASQYSTVRSPTAPVSPTSMYSSTVEADEQSQWPLSKLPRAAQPPRTGNSQPSRTGNSKPSPTGNLQPTDFYNQKNVPLSSRIPLRTNRTNTPSQDNLYNVSSKRPVAMPDPPRSIPAPDTTLDNLSDFPMPGSGSVALKSSNQPLQPPRRGISSYYSQYTNVSPIIEESEGRNSVRSYASSTAIPSNIGNFYDEADSPSDEDEFIFEQADPSLYRTASIGKRGRPSLTAIKTPDMNKSPLPVLQQLEEKTYRPNPASASQESLVKKPTYLPGAALPSTSQIEVDKYLKDLEKDQVSASEMSTLKQVKRGTLADRVGTKIPPRINVAAVRDAENRASLTSLPDLIRRATKLAANLDRGKTASRLGTEWLTQDGSGGFKLDLEKDTMGSRPRLASPADLSARDTGSRSDDRSGRPILAPNQRRKAFHPRQCCGMSWNSFVGVMIILILLICAAVVIPVALVLIPRNKATAAAAGNSTCAKKIPCQNGGVSMAMSDGTCICLCGSGNSGFMCQSAPDMGCGTIAIPALNNATVGTEVESLMLAANSNFSIPLNNQLLLEDFAKFNMSCAAENALVTFPNVPSPARSLTFAEVNSNQGKQESASTANGILVAATATASDAPVVTGTPGGQTATLVNIVANRTAIQFAKVGILFVLQDSQAIAVASGAQEKLLSFLTTATQNGSSTLSQAQNVDLGSGYSIDLWERTLTLKNGTIYGNGWNGTATRS